MIWIGAVKRAAIWILGEMDAISWPRVTAYNSVITMIRGWNPVPFVPADPWPKCIGYT
jgi:hypothetical protein